jgi:hypothetical protein
MASLTPDALISAYTTALSEGKTEKAEALRALAVDAGISVPEPPSKTESGWRGFAQGGTFGFGDELSGLVGASLESLGGSQESFGDLYELYRDSQRQQNEAARLENPYSYGAGEFAGGFAVPGVGTLGAANKLQQVSSALRPGGRLMAAGAGAGAVAGAGYSEDDLLTDTAVGAGAGAVLAPAAAWGLSRLSEGAAGLLGGVRRRLAGTPDEQARLRISHALEAEDLTSVEQVRARLSDIGPEARLADLGPTIRQEGVLAAKTPGPGRRIAQDFVEERARGQQARLNVAAEEMLDPKWTNYRQYLDDIARERTAQAAPLYDEAYTVPIRPTGEMNRISLTPAFQQAAKRAQTNVMNELETVGGGSGLQPDGSITTRFADQIGRELQDMISAAQRSGDNNYARQLIAIRKAFNNEIYSQNPTLQAARNVFAGAKDLEDAAEAGRSLLTGRKQYGDDVEALLDGFTEGETDAFRVGVTRGIFDKLSDAADTHDAGRRLFNSTRVENLIRNTAPSEEAFNSFMAKVKAERGMQETRNKVMGGSSTFENLASEGGTMLPRQELSGRGLIGVVRDVLQNIGGEKVDVDRLTTEDYAELAKYLFGEVSDADIEKILRPTLRGKIASPPGGGRTTGRLSAPAGTAASQTVIGDDIGGIFQ